MSDCRTELPPAVAAEGDDEAGAAGAWGFVEQPLQEVIDAVREALKGGAPTVSTRRAADSASRALSTPRATSLAY